MRERPKFRKVDEEMQRWCGLLGDELTTWPQVSIRPFFGMTAFYRGEQIFAAVPRTRTLGTERSVLIKLPGATDRRLAAGSGRRAGWVTFELESEADIPAVLVWLGKAYQRVAGR
jgi:hypothetical protein